ncbi:MAG TPA: hypothetical protein VGN11_06345 [Candidatus Baltobacteraceae bacterium]|nr:hypothetical protein [Candidatus Baltobacteraceae bacterium]
MFRRYLFGVVLIVSALLCNTVAPADVDMSSGIRYVVANGSAAECSAKAKTALNTYLQNASEPTPGSGEWLAFGPAGGNGASTAAATVRCYPVGSGYVVTFTCAVQTPGNPYAAAALCLDVAHNFSGKAVTALATPTPPPSGCTTASLVGTWVSNDTPGLTFQMTLSGDVTDNSGVSGNWALSGNTVTLTYYGNHTLTLSADGKHVSGRGYNLTRKC